MKMNGSSEQTLESCWGLKRLKADAMMNDVVRVSGLTSQSIAKGGNSLAYNVSAD